MNATSFQSKNNIRLQFTHAMSEMYRQEVPLYQTLLALAKSENDKVSSENSLTSEQSDLLNIEHHGAIRVGTAEELSMIRRLFSVMGMKPVDYYDLSVAGIPVHSTAFRALSRSDLEKSPFRVFCSLLRLDLIEDIDLREKAQNILLKRCIFPKQLLELIALSEKQGGLGANQASMFIDNALEVFRWHENAAVDKSTYEELKTTHGLVADIVSFKGPHINHLTPKVLDIDACQLQFTEKKIKAKTYVEGPPKRRCPILLRQTSFIAIAEEVIFTDGRNGTHTARFGEVEQRGVALTPKGRKLYDKLLSQARNDATLDYLDRLENAFNLFPDTNKELHLQDLAYFYYKPTSKKITNKFKEPIKINELIEQGHLEIRPIIYQDFLPVSAAGIFNSNLSENGANKRVHDNDNNNENRESFEKDLGVQVIRSFDLYEAEQKQSLNEALKNLGLVDIYKLLLC